MASLITGTYGGKQETPQAENIPLSTVPKEVLIDDLFPFLDLNTLINLRATSKELYHFVNIFLKIERNAKIIGLTVLYKDSHFYAVGKNVAYKVFSDSIWDAILNDSFKNIDVTPDDIRNSFSSGVTLFKSEKAAKEKIKRETSTFNQVLYEKPCLASVNLQEDVILAKLERDKIGYNPNIIFVQRLGKCQIQYLDDIVSIESVPVSEVI